MRIKTNDQIRYKEIRVINGDKNLGIMSSKEGRMLAKSLNLDLIEISGTSNPPVCKILDYGKFKYETSKNKKRVVNKEKEVKLGVQIGSHDFSTKLKHIKEFLEDGHKVKVTITFKGRQLAHPELGFELSQNIIKELTGFRITNSPKKSGRTIYFNVE